MTTAEPQFTEKELQLIVNALGSHSDRLRSLFRHGRRDREVRASGDECNQLLRKAMTLLTQRGTEHEQGSKLTDTAPGLR